ncbi:hypothetical protein [Dyella jiangningensis]|uniref:Uncharacterized protein n=1 Tax=Dyella jiangningensis TaxID=1379159 RepID=A0A328P3N6_9GAMM|nr:hypothetical protein [Dyella jiangningensis]RAO75155.1 hypothetical protein CA260_13705 [Dyella jiangningensis]
MKKLFAAMAMAGLIAHAQAETPPTPPGGHHAATAAGEETPDQRKDAAVIPGATAGSAAEGNLTPAYIGASVAGAAVIVGALTGGGSRDGTGGTGGTTGTTGTH